MLCEGKKVYEKPGTCPVCHMYLTAEKDAEDESIKPLSSIEYRVELKMLPEEPKANEEVTLTFTPYLTKDNSVLKKLAGEDKFGIPVDLIAQDLHSINRLIAESGKDGAFTVKTKFAEPGNYIAYVRLTPEGARKQVFPMAIKVAGQPPKEVPLKKLSTSTAKSNGKTIKLSISPKLQIYKYSHFKFKVEGKDLPKNAKLVVISEDTTWYFEDEKVMTLDKKAATVEFYVRPPKFGSYKVWFNDSEFRFTL